MTWQNQQSDCAPIEDSDQPGHLPSLIRVFGSSLCAQWVAKDPSFLHADSEYSDQTGRIPRLIWVFAGRTHTLLVLSCHGLISVIKYLSYKPSANRVGRKCKTPHTCIREILIFLIYNITNMQCIESVSHPYIRHFLQSCWLPYTILFHSFVEMEMKSAKMWIWDHVCFFQNEPLLSSAITYTCTCMHVQRSWATYAWLLDIKAKVPRT